jgi:8-oxo-dGTP pyrophosphatase MutT (NUDIX family)
MKKGVVFVLQDGQHVLMEYRLNQTKAFYRNWVFPGGWVEPGEDDYLAFIRECKEELGQVYSGFCIGNLVAEDSPEPMLLYVYLCQKWLAKIPPRILDTVNPLGWRYLLYELDSEVRTVREIVQMVIEYNRQKAEEMQKYRRFNGG